MNKFLIATLLALSSITASAGPASIAFEYEFEAPHGANSNDTNSLSVIPGYVLDNGVKLDVKLKGSQKDTNTTTASIEPRAKYLVDLGSGVSVGGRVSLGEVYDATGNYGFYTIEPIAQYDFNKVWSASTSVKYKDGTGNVGAESVTYYLGGAYKVSDTQTVAAKVYTRDNTGATVNTSGVEVNYAFNF